MFYKVAALVLLKITVVIYNSEAMAERDLARGETVAAQILRDAGVEVRWKRATRADVNARPDEIPLHLLAKQPVNLNGEMAGFAVLMPETSYAGVSCPSVRRTAETLGSDDGTILGAVMAHELGHVLLGSKSHASSGVMVMRFGPREVEAARRGELHFLRPEAQRIRAEVSRRDTISQ